VYVAALADGERRLVPWRSRWHILTCGHCRHETRLHAAVTTRLRETLSPGDPADVRLSNRPPLRRRWVLPVVASSGAILAATAVLLGAGLGADPVPAAVAAASNPPVMLTSDRNQIQLWCQQHAIEPPAVIALPGLSLGGARMDLIHGDQATTVYYSTASGQSVTATWMGNTATTQLSMETHTVGSKTAILVKERGHVVVVSGPVSSRDLIVAADTLASEMAAG